MRTVPIGLIVFILAFISVGALAQDMASNATANISAPSESVSAPAGPANMQGIWKVSLAGTEITMAVNQSGDSLFGQCKFEGDTPWNGVVSGSVSGRAVNIAMAALEGNVLVATEMSGTVTGNSILGSYVKSDSSGNAAKGELTATRTSTDTAEYTPAKTETSAEAATQQTPSTEQYTQLGSQTSAEKPAVSTNNGRYNDVTQLAKSIDPVILPRHAEL